MQYLNRFRIFMKKYQILGRKNGKNVEFPMNFILTLRNESSKLNCGNFTYSICFYKKAGMLKKLWKGWRAMKKKQCCALLLAFAMTMTSLPTVVLAKPAQGAEEALETLGEEELSEMLESGEGVSADAIEVEAEDAGRLEDGKSQAKEPQVEPLYKEDEMVTVIVELEEAPVMDYYGTSTFAAEAEEDSDIMPGEAVSGFLASEDAQSASQEILEGQEEVISEINEVAGQADGKKGKAKVKAEDVEVVAQWTAAANAMAVRIPFGKLDEIKEMDHVKRAYVQHVYERPEPVENSNVVEGKPYHSYSYDMVDVQSTWKEGYTGKGMLVAILDSGLDIRLFKSGADVGRVQYTHEAFTDNSFMGADENGKLDWNLRYTEDSMEKFLAGNKLVSTTGQDGNIIHYDNNALYKNRKVPYGADYADGDVHIYPPESDHGTHVAGTVAGYAEGEDGVVKFSGVAPDAQILFMKVFPDVDGGAEESSLVNAIEDSLKLGADLINLSLGSDAGYAVDDTIQNDVFARIEDAGVAMMTSAGNSDYSTSGNNYEGESLTSDPDTSVMSSPAMYDSNLSVASIDNAIDVQSYFTWKDKDNNVHKVPFSDPFSVAMKYGFSDKEYPIYKVGGVGNREDYEEVGFNRGWGGVTGLALVKRGEISFTDKINNAMDFTAVNSQNERLGVLGVIIYDDNPEGTELINMSADGTAITSAFINGRDGAAIVAALDAGYQVKIQVSEENQTVDNATFGEMSSFTSWGPGPGLELKPEITAPGGNIWSTVVDRNASDEGYAGTYGMMSGTSMAAPHMSGISALVRQYITSNRDIFRVSSAEMGDLISQLLVSTAIPQKDGEAYYSPRQQGAGLVNAAAAISTPAYITVEGKHVGKLELLDDPEKKGVYDFGFQVNNISDKDLAYQAKVVLMRPDTKTVESKWGNRTALSAHDVVISTTDLGEITVPAKGTQKVQKSVSLTEEQKYLLSNMFENGIYVEGYVILTDKEGKNPQIGLPLLAFYGDWTTAPIFDRSYWFDEAADGESVINNESSWATSLIGFVLDGVGYYDLGQNLFRSEEGDQTVYHKENFTISPNGDNFFDYINDFVLYQLRNARLVVFEVKDQETGEVYFKDWASYSFKSLYEPSAGFTVPFGLYGTYPVWRGEDMQGRTLPSGTKCTYTITAYGEGDFGEEIYVDSEGRKVTNFDAVMNGEYVPTFNGHAMDMTGDVVSFPIMVDTVAPKLENNAVSFFEKYGRTYMIARVHDEDGSLASIEVAPYVRRTYKEGYGDPSYSEIATDRVNTFYQEDIYDAGRQTRTFIADVTEYTRKPSYDDAYYNYEWTGDILLSCGDYGANDRSYAIHVDSKEGIALSQTSARLRPGDEFELSANDNTLGASELTRTSSNPEVATIDEFGKVKAVAPGQAVITVSNGSSFGICVVIVENRNTEVKDFKLSMEKFSGLKPDGECIVKITDLQPADVVLDEVRWVVEEDDDYAEDYAEGLIQVSKYSTDGLAGSLYLYASQSDELLPAGEGTLTVTLNGVSRSMRIGWQDIYTERDQDDLVSADNYNVQSYYVAQGEKINLAAKYRQTGPHSFCEIVTDLKGLKLDGPTFYNDGAQTYSAKLVNEEGYALPEDIQVRIVYGPGDEYPLPKDDGTNPYTPRYSYDPATGEVNVPYTPYGSSNQMKIVAEGVEAPGNPAGTMSGIDHARPDTLYGPFDWAVTEGKGTLELVDVTDNYGDTHQEAQFMPSEPGVSYITATTKDKKYSTNFVVVSEPIKAEKVVLSQDRIEMEVGGKVQIDTSLTPEPTLAEDKEIVWTSYDESVATVENGEITAVSEGYAYIKAESARNNKVFNCVIVHVKESKAPEVDKTSIQLSEEEITLDVNESKTLTATVTSADEENKEVAWSSNRNEVATVSSNGKVTAIAKGVATITAKTKNGVTATCKVTVNRPSEPGDPSTNVPTSITLNKDTLTLDVNGTETLTATVAPATAEDRSVSWSTNNASVAAVTGSGKVTAIAKGVATITARTSNGLTATCKVTVNQPSEPGDPSKNEPTSITLNKDTLTLDVNGTETLTATVAPATAEDRSVSWSTNNASVAAVTGSGKVTAIAKGVATITARTSNGLTATCKVTVNQPTGSGDPSKNEPTSITLNKDALTLDINGTETLIATVAPSTAEDRSVAWSTNNPEVAVVTIGGKVTAIGAGEATITARTSNGLAETCKVTVRKRELAAQEALTISGVSSLAFSKSATLKVTGGSGDGAVTWSIVSGKEYATINAKTGKVLATGIGTVKVKAVKAGDSQYKEAEATFQFKAVMPKKNEVVTVNGAKYKVTGTAKGKETVAYAGATNKNITKAVIPASVKIGGKAFKVTSISKNALKGYKKLKSVSIHKNVTVIGTSAFQACTALTKVTIPANVKTVGMNAFSHSTKLKSIIVKSKKVTKVGAKAFKGIHKKAKIKVPSSKLKQYKKLFGGKGQAKTVKITK